MDSTRKERIAAAAITAVIAVVGLIVLLTVVLTFPPRDWEERHPVEEESELLFGGEYVMLGDIPVPSSAESVTRSDARPRRSRPLRCRSRCRSTCRGDLGGSIVDGGAAQA